MFSLYILDFFYAEISIKPIQDLMHWWRNRLLRCPDYHRESYEFGSRINGAKTKRHKSNRKCNRSGFVTFFFIKTSFYFHFIKHVNVYVFFSSKIGSTENILWNWNQDDCTFTNRIEYIDEWTCVGRSPVQQSMASVQQHVVTRRRP